MNSFVITNCTYDGSSGDLNPLCCITGTVNGLSIFPQVFFAYLMAANAAGQMQQALTAVMFNYYVGYQATLPWPNPIPFPSFPASNAVAVHSEGVYPVAPVVVSEALIGSWSA